MPKPELVRIRMADGSVVNHTRAWAERHELEVLEGRPAVVAGREVQHKNKVSVNEAASNKSGGNKSASNKEESK